MTMMIENSNASKIVPDPNCQYCHGKGTLPLPPGVNIDPPLSCFCIRKQMIASFKLPSTINEDKILSLIKKWKILFEQLKPIKNELKSISEEISALLPFKYGTKEIGNFLVIKTRTKNGRVQIRERKK